VEADHIILHCSATRDSGTVSWDAIRRFHTDIRGWSDIGYHFGVEEVNGVLAILRGRNMFTQGAHCRAGGMNSHSIGVCVVGDYDLEPPDPYRVSVTLDLLTKLCFVLSIPAAHVLGHGELEVSKSCPGTTWNMNEVRAKIANRLVSNDGISDVHQWTQYSGDNVLWLKEP
jgi:N-acetylmuramoyl-L-alanine amidase